MLNLGQLFLRQSKLKFLEKTLQIFSFLKENLLTIWLVIWFWLIWFLGSGQWQVIVLGIGTLLNWLVGWWWLKLNSKSSFSSQPLSFDLTWILSSGGLKWWLFWFGILILTTLTSQVWTVSWLQLNWWLVAFSWYWWLGGLRPTQLARKILLQSLLLGVTSAVVIGWWLTWQRPMWSFNLSSLTYIFPSYGHHHLSALIVLIWPFVWTKLVKVNTWLWRTIAGILSLSLLMSFSRSAMIAVFFQMAVWYWLQVAEPASIKKKLWQQILIIFLIFFAAISFYKSSSGWLPPTLVNKVCYSWWAPPGLCVIGAEPRLNYWSQALVVWQNLPWLGSGPGTFGLVVKRWVNQTLNQSSYTHQVWLQNLAEMGLVGFLAWLAIFTNWWRQFWQKSRLESETLFWRLGVVGGLIIGLFDFDWQMMGFWLPFLGMLVVWIPADKTSLTAPTSRNLNILAAVLNLWLLITVVASGLGGIGLLGSSQTAGWLNWWRVWPMQAEWYKKINLTDRNQEFFRNYLLVSAPKHPDLIYSLGINAPDKTKLFYWQEIQYQLDPWKYWDGNPLNTVVASENWPEAEKVALRFEVWLEKNHQHWQNTQNENFTANLIKLANHEFLVGNYGLGVRLLQLSQKLEVWVLHFKPLNFTEIEKNLPSQPELALIELAKLDQARFGDNVGEYLHWLQLLAAKAISQLAADPAYLDWKNMPGVNKSIQNQSALTAWASRVESLAGVFVKIFPQNSDQLESQVTDLQLLSFSAKILQLQLDPAYQNCQTDLNLAVLPLSCDGIGAWAAKTRRVGQEFLQTYPTETSRPKQLAATLADLVISAGDSRVGGPAYDVAEFYNLGIEITPWIMSHRLWWFEVVGIDIYEDKQELLVFADLWENFDLAISGYKPQVWQDFYLQMLKLAETSYDLERQKIYQAKLKLIQANLE